MAENGDERPNSSPTAGRAGPRSSWTAGRVIGMVFASIGGLIGLSLLVAGIAVVAAYIFERDDDGYFTTDRQELRSGSFAITSGDIDLGADEVDWAPDELLGDIRVRVEGQKPLFVGIGPNDAVNRYLAGVASAELTDFDGDHPDFQRQKGGAPRTPPAQKRFWVARSQGPGEQALTWDAEFGRWTVVAMNAAGGRGIDVEADVGVKLDWAIWAGLGMLVVGLLMSAGAVVVILMIARRAGP